MNKTSRYFYTQNLLIDIYFLYIRDKNKKQNKRKLLPKHGINYPAVTEYAKPAFPSCLSLEGAASLFMLLFPLRALEH